MRTQTARQMAVANETRQIEESASRAVAARQAEQERPRSALDAMAMRLKVSPDVLRNTLKSTVFSGCRTNEEFVALVLVANEYALNPLLKEIYAFPAKGGGIVPMVGVDGWMKLMNSHPQFDGIKFEDHFDSKGNLFAIEAIVYRKDRSHPTQIIEYLDECRRGTEPWKMMPRRMLRNRVICQAARLAFGFTGIAVEGDEATIDGGQLTSTPPLPSRQSLAEELGDEIPNFDRQTGEVMDDAAPVDGRTGMTEVDEEAARELDQAQGAAQTLADIDGPLEEAPWAGKVEEIKAGIRSAKAASYLKAIEEEYLKHAVSLPAQVAEEIEELLRVRKRDLSGEG